ncbi:uncharacterized protein LOC120774809 isoform X2 [Bactrocera tryoni]|uniref:uncharacterized protein LOC120774809 isoform X2 n=1 Tax=Bactrocera tryoni TaxID=59916 RepID=UPI001A99AC12|nr:uncharacterized protein LOC120774809 isoform X2 [Bactrocera tryoni]
MKLSVSAYRAHASAHKKILSSGYHSQLNYGSTGAAVSSSAVLQMADPAENAMSVSKDRHGIECNSDTDIVSPSGTSSSERERTGTIRKTQQHGSINDNDSNAHYSDFKSSTQNKSDISEKNLDLDADWNRSNQRWMKLRTTVQISSAIQKKPPLKREDSFLKRFSTRQIPETQETVEDTGSESAFGESNKSTKRRRRFLQKRRSVVNPDENFYFYWLMILTVSVLYNLWALIVRQSFPELQQAVPIFWFVCDTLTDVVFVFDIVVQLRTGYLEQGLMVYDDKKLALHYIHSRDFFFDIISLIPLDLIQLKIGANPLLRFSRFFKVYRCVKFYYIVESRTVWPNLWRVINLIHILLILAHWFGCFYYLLSEAEGFQGDWVYPYRPGDYATLTRKYLGSLYWSTLTLTTIGDLPTPETNAEPNFSVDGPRSIPRRGIRSRLLQFGSNYGYIFTIVSYLIGVFIFATIVGQVGNVITNRNANRLEFERLLDGAKTYMRHHKVPGGMKRRVLRWYDYSWSRGRIQGGGDINTALGLLPDKLKTELALHVNLSVLKKVTIFQECQPEFLHDLVLKMKAYIFTPGDSICRKGEVAREMFIIADGILEVLSETGKVLTTMKAGDFFGEIGILNLDGLNKRTADVRSVGYSELFSLSREDVLAAMKDYPEAQEILQTLGRKRLMEVRCVNKKYAKAQCNNEQSDHPHVYSNINRSDSSENSASKKIVYKLRKDVKGIRSMLKKTRTRRSDESLEMQPLQDTLNKGNKTTLKRMSHVRSEEKEEKKEEKTHQDKTPSPIGAGLPLLQRLRLLKEKQDREEKAAKAITPQISPPHVHIANALSPQESIQEEPETEVNEALPLMQRLQMLKNKQETKASDVKLTVKPTSTVSLKQKIQMLNFAGVTKTDTMDNKSKDDKLATEDQKQTPKTLDVQKYIKHDLGAINKSPKAVTGKSLKLIKPSINTSTERSDSDMSIKPWSKLKLATIMSTSSNNLAKSSPGDSDVEVKTCSSNETPQTPSQGTAVFTSTTPSTNTLHSVTATTPNTKPTEQIKILENVRKHSKIVATNHSNESRKSYHSVFDLSPEYSGLPFVKRLKILNERQKLEELEKALQMRSFSLDSSKITSQLAVPEPLYRCFSDVSEMYSQFFTAYESSSSNSTNTSLSNNNNERKDKYIPPAYLPLSPEQNETSERRKLKCILQKLRHNSEECKSAFQNENEDSCVTEKPNKKLLREPTLEGPPNSAHRSNEDEQYEALQTTSGAEDKHVNISHAPIISAFGWDKCPENRVSSGAHIKAVSKRRNTIQLNNNVMQYDPCPSYTNQRTTKRFKTIGDSLRTGDILNVEENFNRVWSEINDVIKDQITEMHLKFELQFSVMAREVRKRDEIIANLQTKIKNIELKTSSPRRKTELTRDKLSKLWVDADLESEDHASSSSSAELLFMRGDSLDTVFMSSPPQVQRHSSSSIFNNVCKDSSGHISSRSLYKNKSEENITMGKQQKRNYVVSVSDLTGNLNMQDSVVLDIGDSSSSSSSSGKLNVKYEDIEQKNVKDNVFAHVHHNDWEVKMLAAEMDKQERKRANSTDFKCSNSILRRRRKFSDTEADISETDPEIEPFSLPRPRASSLDQFNLRYGIGKEIFKAISIDRDKNKL